ncbi:hypothetical protein C496_00170 [Natronorubrum tibetense GA33]|uniref:Uncharacterized protein n=1 Tax=Natronorubrum tibetense GA33 TaxID=1114856 RepID=L9WBI7_9EURY|nr:hypothetical protein C496_00170 [Natronorubrum tibetense GA33]
MTGDNKVSRSQTRNHRFLETLYPLQFDERVEVYDGGETTFVAAARPVEQVNAGTSILEAAADGTEAISDDDSVDTDDNKTDDTVNGE